MSDYGQVKYYIIIITSTSFLFKIILQIVKGLRLTYETGRTKDVHFRIAQLRNLLRLYEENRSELCKALYKDLRKPDFESYFYEILLLSRDVKNAINKLQSWSKPKYLPKNLICLSDKVYYDHQPHGLVRK
jgi:aldehyde dehydrogenase (NAD+)